MRKTLIVVLVLTAVASAIAVGAYARNCSIYNVTSVSAVVTPSVAPEATVPALSTTSSPAAYRKITADQARARMDSGDPIVIVDVRTPEEFTSGHIPGAINVPNEGILNQMPEELPDPNAEILVYCRSGRRSKEAANKLIEMGYTNVFDFGGIIDWPYDVEA